MSDIKLQADPRTPGRSNARALRREGVVPGVYYHHGDDPISVGVEILALRPLITSTESHLVTLVVSDGTEKLCILKEVIYDPITDRPVHFDLMGVAAGEMMKVSISIVLDGRPAGLADGGILQHQANEVEIECLPKNLPEHISVDISGLSIGDSIHVGDLEAGEFTFLTPDNVTIASLIAPRLAVEADEDGDGLEGAVSAEPELIGKGKKDEGDEGE